MATGAHSDAIITMNISLPRASKSPYSSSFFHKRLCGPLANSRFHHRPDPQYRPDSRLEAAYHRADTAIQRVVDLMAAA